MGTNYGKTNSYRSPIDWSRSTKGTNYDDECEANTWPDVASASVRRDTANHTCIHIWWAAIASGPWRAAIDVPNVIVVRTARVLPRRKPPISSQSCKQKKLKNSGKECNRKNYLRSKETSSTCKSTTIQWEVKHQDNIWITPSTIKFNYYDNPPFPMFCFNFIIG
jgi:hypothetical protein